MTKLKAIIYVRVSDPQQVSGTSLEFQEEECRKFCERKGMEVVAVFREEGETAKDLSLSNRQEFLRALEFSRKHKGQVQAFVVLRVDRFARNTEDHFAVRKILLDYGVTLHSVTENIGNSPAEKFIETVLAGASEYDNAIRRRRCIDGMMARLSQGIYPWKPPMGYICAHTKKRGEKKREADRSDGRTFPIIQRALKEYARGLCSQAELSRKLDEWGLSKARGRKSTPQLVDRVLGQHLKFYTGILVNPWTREEYRGLHQPMISEEEMHRIRLLKCGKALEVKRDRFNPLFPLRRTVLCSACGHWLTGSVSRGNGGRYAYYHCTARSCARYGKAIPKVLLEADFLQYLERITPKEEFLAIFKETVLDLWQEKKAHLEAEGRMLRGELMTLEERCRRVFDLYESGAYAREEFQERREEVENQIAAAKISLSECRIDELDVEGVLTYATTFIGNLPRQWFDLPQELRPRFQRLVFPEGIPYERDQGFGTTKLGFIYQLNLQFSGVKSHVVSLRGFDWNQLIRELKAFQQLHHLEDNHYSH
jgi:DNA invertase Pin-like site-specific DNA recombinase